MLRLVYPEAWAAERVGRDLLRPTLYRLANPRQAIWDGEPPRIEAIGAAGELALRGRPFVFVHGIEYGSAEEVLRDLVFPFEREAKIFRDEGDGPWDVFFVSWNSKVTAGEEGEAFRTFSARRLKAVLGHALSLRFHVETFEIKARQVARYLEPFIGAMLDQAGAPPMVVSHSLGSYIWAQVVSRLVKKGRSDAEWGEWWNMQPAIHPRDYDPSSGALREVHVAYDGIRSRQMVWYSALDVVLLSLYLCGKKGLAMGQIGARNLNVARRNVTLWAREAHGAASFRSGEGFFKRIGHLLQAEAERLPKRRAAVSMI